mmetsp:Transcript_23146/g.38259  ORF Transcript_23146/g.38259 Transcript_23146/m.38259 type:complete len:858 (+) Transcript_23146:140-2713(+)
MGLDLAHVLSSERHHCEFECGVCKRLTSLDSYVTSACSHVICKSCCYQKLHDKCPTCRKPIVDGDLANLNEVQPLAYRILCRVKVACPLRKRHQCSWAGDYNELQSHVDFHRRNDRQKSSRSLRRGVVKDSNSTRNEKEEGVMNSESAGRFSSRSVMKVDSNRSNSSRNEKEERVMNGESAGRSSNSIMKGGSSRSNIIESSDMNDDTQHHIMIEIEDKDTNGSDRSLPQTTTAADDVIGDIDQTILRKSDAPPLPAINPYEAVSISTDAGEKKASKTPAVPAITRRRWSTMDIICQEELQDDTRPAVPRRRNSSDMVSLSSGSLSSSSINAETPGQRSDDLVTMPQQIIGSHDGTNATDAQNRSKNARGQGRVNDKTSSSDGINNTKSADGGDLTQPSRAFKEIASRAFRDGNYHEAVSSYSKAIDAFPNNNATNKDDCTSFMSTMYANRAVANLRLSLYSECIYDSDEALRLDYSNVKAYLRKSWAQVEIGRFEDACTTLAIGLGRIPKCATLEREIKLTQILSQTMKDVRRLQNQEEHFEVINATDALEKVHKSNKHVALARGKAYIYLNETEKAIEEANVVLISDSENTEALEIRAKARYLDARLEDALEDCHHCQTIQTALGIDSQRSSIGDFYEKVRKVHQLYSDAERTMLNESYKQAANMYGMAIHATEPLAKSTELYRVLYLARAEAHFHASKFIQALANADIVLASQHTYLPAWKTKIKALKAMGKFEQLLIDLADVIEGDDNWGVQHQFLVDAQKDAKEHLLTHASTKKDENYYQFLGVESTASFDEIRRMYRLKARDCHPDKFLAATDSEQIDAEDRFQLLQQCSDVLSNFDSRQAYDAQLGLVSP